MATARKVLEDSQTVGDSFEYPAGTYMIWLVGTVTGTYTLQMDNEESGWADTEVVLTNNTPGEARLAGRKHRISGTVAGVNCYLQAIDALPI